MKNPTDSIDIGELNEAIEKKVVLFIDDDLDALELVSLVFDADFKVFTAHSGQAALELLMEITQPDLILLDTQMDGMSGPEFLLELEKERPDLIENVPIVFLTGMDQVPASKAVGVIRKPYDLDILKADIHRLIGLGSCQLNKHLGALPEHALSATLL